MNLTNESRNSIDFKKIGIQSAMAFLALVLIGYGIAFIITESQYVTYKDDYYKIRIKYPKAWKAIPDHGGTIVTFISVPDNELDGFAENFNISVTDLPEHIKALPQFSKIATGQMEAVFDTSIEILKSEEFVFAGMSAYKYIIRTNQSPTIELGFVWFFKDNKAFVLTYVIQEFQYQKYIKIFDHMLRSFSIGSL